jgi:hypothetical protein
MSCGDGFLRPGRLSRSNERTFLDSEAGRLVGLGPCGALRGGLGGGRHWREGITRQRGVGSKV